MYITVPKSPFALAAILFGMELALAVVFTIAGRMTGVDVSAAFFGSVRLYLAACALAFWYARTRQQSMTSLQASRTGLIYSGVNFIILSVLFALHGTTDPVRAVTMVVGALIVLTVQYLVLWFLLLQVSAIALEHFCEERKLPGLE